MEATIYDISGTEIEKITLNPDIFELSENPTLIQQAVVRQRSHARLAHPRAKTRGQVSGSTRKLFRQKGTGRARAGSSRSPTRIGGGKAFGPHGNQNYTKQMPTKQRRKALFIALSSRARASAIMGLNSYDHKEIKTKNVTQLIDKLKIARSCLIITPTKHDILKRSAKNIPNVKVVEVPYLNIVDTLHYRQLVFLKDSFTALEKVFLGRTVKSAADTDKLVTHN